jgi:methylmalonyl-CoA mutase
VANAYALKALSKGATGLQFVISADLDVNALFEGILLEHIFCVIEIQSADAKVYEKVNAYIQAYKSSMAIEHLHLVVAPIALMEQAIIPVHVLEGNVLDALSANFSAIKINTGLYANAGAHQTQQLTYAIAHLNAYLSLPNAVQALQNKTIVFEVAVGSNYFFEIAKHRALRQLVLFLLATYEVNAEIIILSKTAYYNKSAADSYSNLLRTSTEAMSAIIGGCNALCVGRFDVLTQDKQEQAAWWALNQSLILEHESYFNQIADVSAGSYYIEHVTRSFCELAWQMFQAIEAEGGWLHYLESGEAERNVKEACSQLIHQYQSKEKWMIGVNQFVNADRNYTPDYSTALNGKFSAFNIAQSVKP